MSNTGFMAAKIYPCGVCRKGLSVSPQGQTGLLIDVEVVKFAAVSWSGVTLSSRTSMLPLVAPAAEWSLNVTRVNRTPFSLP